MLTKFQTYVDRMREDRDDYPLEEMEWRTIWPVGDLDATDLDQLRHSLPTPVVTAIELDLCWLAGGHLRRWIAQEPMDEADLDLFFPDEGSKSATEMMISNPEYGFQETFRCPEGKLTTYMLERGDAPPIKVQCIAQRYYESPLDVIDSFDFTIAQFAYDGNALYMGDWSLLHLDNKILRFWSLPYPAATMRRMTKFAKLGYWLPEETALDFIYAILTAQVSWNPNDNTEWSMEGGEFRDGRDARLNGDDVNRWYID